MFYLVLITMLLQGENFHTRMKEIVALNMSSSASFEVSFALIRYITSLLDNAPNYLVGMRYPKKISNYYINT